MKRILASAIAFAVVALGVVTAAPAQAATGLTITTAPAACASAADGSYYAGLALSGTNTTGADITVNVNYGANPLSPLTTTFTVLANQQTTLSLNLSPVGYGNPYFVATEGVSDTGTVPNCTPNPNGGQSQVTSPACITQGIPYSVTNTNSFGVIVVTASLDDVMITTTFFSAAAGQTDGPGFWPIDPSTTLGDHILKIYVQDEAVTKLVDTFVVTITNNCAVANPADFSASLDAPVITSGGTTGTQVLHLANAGKVDRQSLVYVGGNFVGNSPLVLAGSTDTQLVLNVPLCADYPVVVSFGFPDPTLNQTVAKFGCATPLPTRLSGPSIAGTVRVGSVLTCNVSYADATSVSYGWKRNGAIITGATKSTYVLTAADYGKQITCESGALNSIGSIAVAVSASSAVVAIGPALKATIAPKVVGTVARGKTVKANVGRWTPTAKTYFYQWYKDGRAIKGATKLSFKIPTPYKGHKLSVRVIARTPGYTQGAKVSASVKVK